MPGKPCRQQWQLKRRWISKKLTRTLNRHLVSSARQQVTMVKVEEAQSPSQRRPALVKFSAKTQRQLGALRSLVCPPAPLRLVGRQQGFVCSGGA